MKSTSKQQMEFRLFQAHPEVQYHQPTPPPPPVRPRPDGFDQELTTLCHELVLDLGLSDLANQIKVSWNARLRTTAGRAYCDSQAIELNPALVDISEDEIDRTLRHELAHLIAYYRARKQRIRIEPHGPEWRTACTDLGIDGEDRCHNLPFKRVRQQRKFAYTCPSCGHQIFRVRRIRKQAACYTCCQEHNNGRFDSKYQLVEVKLGDASASLGQ